MSTLKHDNYEECEEDVKCDWWGDRERRSRKGGRESRRLEKKRPANED